MRGFADLDDSELLSVRRPAQYLGGEPGCVCKSDQELALRVCLAFPDTYQVGMSHLGLQILYQIVNARPDWSAERAFVPEPDMERLLRSRNIALYSLENKLPLHTFDVLGISLQYELCATGVLTLLDLGGIPLRAEQRAESHPIVIGGGPLACQPEPLADFFDLFFLGDGEEAFVEICQILMEQKKQGKPRAARLAELQRVRGIYRPSAFIPQYDSTGAFTAISSQDAEIARVQRRILPSLSQAPAATPLLAPTLKPIHDRIGIEIMRGCIRGCRFCQAGYIYRPQRERAPAEVLELAENSIRRSGYQDISLLSLSSADYSSILPLLSSMREACSADPGLSFSFPSTRVDALSPELLQASLATGAGNFTIAPEAATERLRTVINKGLRQEQILDTCRNAFAAGCQALKLYFMIGLPTETEADLAAILTLAQELKRLGGHRQDITVSISTFVPKAHTPFQWARQISEAETLERQNMLRQGLKQARVKMRWHNAFASLLEGVLARGDRRLSAVIERAYRLGCRLDSWDEHLQSHSWRQAFAQCGINPERYLSERSVGSPLPWQHLDTGVRPEFLREEWNKARSEIASDDCRGEACSACGVCDFTAIKNRRYHSAPAEPDAPSAPPLYPQQAAKQRLRIQYSKDGPARFIAHHDMTDLITRALRRCSVCLAYSQGFTARPKLSFGPPLPLGTASSGEYVDAYLRQPEEPDRLAEQLRSLLPQGIALVNVQEIPLNAASIQEGTEALIFQAIFHEHRPGELEIAEQIANWQQAHAQRVRKGETTIVPLATCITDMRIENGNLVLAIRTGGNRPTIKPEEALSACLVPKAWRYTLRKIQTVFSTAATPPDTRSADSADPECQP